MTLEQLLSPAVLEWEQSNKHLPKEQLLKEFDKWIVENEEQINISVKNNIDEINGYIERGMLNAQLLTENANENEDDFDWDDIFSDLDDDETEKPKEPISGKIETEDEKPTVIEPSVSISGKYILSNDKKNKKLYVFNAINILYDFLEKNKKLNEKNTLYWSRFDMSRVTDATALLAFTDIRNADLSSWDMSNVKTMEGMFYKSTFNNDSICGWDVSSCTDFLRMFTFSDFNQSLKKWKPGYVEKTEYDDAGNIVYDSDGKEKKIRVRANLPLIGAAADEEDEMIRNFWEEKFKDITELKENKTLKPMKHILDYETFVNEGFKDFIKKGFDKVKSFFKNITIKMGNFVASFNKNGEIFNASSPYTALNYISDGKVEGVSAFTTVKNEYLNDNVKSIASIVESPEYYGIIDKNSNEYKNYLTMVNMITEHYNKYGDKLNESTERVGLSGKDGGLKGIKDISSKTLKFLLNQVIKNVPAYKDDKFGGALLIWGAPGVGKSTIPKSIIKEWNQNHELNEKKSLLVVECGNLTVDGFSLPIPMTKTVGEYLKEKPIVAKKLKEKGIVIDDDFLNEEIKVSGEALKTWVPCYKVTANDEHNKIQNDIANGRIMSEHKNGQLETIETTEGGIILFDEFFRANSNVFKILMQIILTRTFNGEYLLGDKWGIIACSNRPNDDIEVGDGFESTGAVLGTRFGAGQFNFVPDFDEWKEWAVKYGDFDDATITFLMQEKDTKTGEYTNWHTVKPLEYDAGKTAWPTPRTWSMLMTELRNIKENEGYDSIQEIPLDIIELKAYGTIGEEMAQKYVQFLKTFKSDFIPSEVLDNADYSIPTDMKCSEVIHRLKKHIDLVFSKDKLPSDEQMMNMFNTLEKTYNPSKDNFVRPLYISIFNKFDFFENSIKFVKEDFPNFTKLVMKKYGLKSSKELKEFLV